jgi:hypothetical protein
MSNGLRIRNGSKLTKKELADTRTQKADRHNKGLLLGRWHQTLLPQDHLKIAEGLEGPLNDFSALNMTIILDIIHRLVFSSNNLSETGSLLHIR